jgi:hypothetical protein
MKHQPEINLSVTYNFNIINLMRLRDHMLWLQDLKSKPKVGFNMATYCTSNKPDMSPHYCGTTACLAGHAVFLSGIPLDSPDDISNTNYFSLARDWLGINQNEAQYLFSGTFARVPMAQVTLDKAIEELNYMIERGHTSLKD